MVSLFNLDTMKNEFVQGDSFNNVNFYNNLMEMDTMDTDTDKVYLEITEQPIDKFRFRYKSEMHGTHGSLTGITTHKSKKTYPTVQLHGFNKIAIIRCSLYQANGRNLHPHSLVVRRDNDDHKDPHDVSVSPQTGYTAVFQGMGIIHTAKKFIEDEILDKLKRQLEFENHRMITHLEKTKLERQAAQEAKTINLNQVCLYFEAFQEIDGRYKSICEPILSKPINNMKSALTGELKITRLSLAASSVSGNDELFLFVEKVGKKNIKVRFFEINSAGEEIWEDYGQFSEADVHHQYAIALRTPPYKDQNITSNIKVFIELVRPSDDAVSEPMNFMYTPDQSIGSIGYMLDNSVNMKSIELPTVLPNKRISEEFNKSDIIRNLPTNISFDVQSAEYESFLQMVNKRSTEFADFMEEIPAVLKTDGDCADRKEVSMNCKAYDENIKNWVSNIANKYGPTRSKTIISEFILKKLKKGNNIFHHMIKFNSEYIFEFVNLFNFNHFLHTLNERDENCLHIAVEWNRPNHIIPLVQRGSKLNSHDIDGNTPLHLAVKKNHENCVKELLKTRTMQGLKKYLNVDMHNNEGMTALHLAIRSNDFKIFKLLLDNHRPSSRMVELKTKNNILHLAVEQKSEKMVRYILEHTQVSVSEVNAANRTAMDLANGAPSIQQILKEDSKMDKDQDSQNAITSTDEDDASTDSTSLDSSNAVNEEDNKYVNPEQFPVMVIKTEKPDYDESMPFDTDNPENCLISDQLDTHALYDDACLKQLCVIFNKNSKWKALAEYFDCATFIEVWNGSKNPSMMLFKFLEVQDISIDRFLKIFEKVEPEALCCIDKMSSRRLNNADVLDMKKANFYS